MTVSELESVCLEFGEAIQETISEKESAGELEQHAFEQISSSVSEWERKSLELCRLLRREGIAE